MENYSNRHDSPFAVFAMNPRTSFYYLEPGQMLYTETAMSNIYGPTTTNVGMPHYEESSLYYAGSLTKPAKIYTEGCLAPGLYLCQCWGAGAEGWSSTSGGRNGGGSSCGGYAKSILRILKPTKVYLVAGTRGRAIPVECPANAVAYAYGGYNGGGDSVGKHNGVIRIGSGGGASDIRLGGCTLKHRIMVAGGAGAPNDTGNGAIAGHAASDGQNPSARGGAAGGTLGPGAGGTSYYGLAINQAYRKGSFGAGGGYQNYVINGVKWFENDTVSFMFCGGGGGWYGGGGSSFDGGAGGGSNFTLTYDRLFNESNDYSYKKSLANSGLTSSQINEMEAFYKETGYFDWRFQWAGGSYTSIPARHSSGSTESNLTPNQDGSVSIKCLCRFDDGPKIFLNNGSWKEV